MDKQYKITVAGIGYVGLSMVALLAQRHQGIAVDIIRRKLECSIAEYHLFRMIILKSILQKRH